MFIFSTIFYKSELSVQPLFLDRNIPEQAFSHFLPFVGVFLGLEGVFVFFSPFHQWYLLSNPFGRREQYLSTLFLNERRPVFQLPYSRKRCEEKALPLL